MLIYLVYAAKRVQVKLMKNDNISPEEPVRRGGKRGILYRLVLKICRGNERLAEILRFCIVGGVATVVDFVAMGITLYCFDPSLYPNFFNVFYGGGTPSVLASCVGTGVGSALPSGAASAAQAVRSSSARMSGSRRFISQHSCFDKMGKAPASPILP